MFKLAFLFLTIGNVYHEGYWRDFFNGHEKLYSIYVHAKERKSVTSAFFKPHLIPEHVPTSWAHTMKAQIALLKEALKDPQNDKFIFLSESTIPLQNFAKVYKTLRATPKSIFKTQPNPHLYLDSFRTRELNQSRIVSGIPFRYQQKHSQWIVLNRKHAAILVSSAHYLKKRHIFCDNEHFPGTVLAYNGHVREIAPEDTTYVNWYLKGPNGRTPFTFSNLKKAQEKALALMALRKGFLFARKFNPNCHLYEIDKFLSYRKVRVPSKVPKAPR